MTVCEPALAPSPGAVSLLFPVADDALDSADPAALAAMPRPLPLVYVGNQYGRDEAFAGFFAPAAAGHRHRVAGNWTRTAQWPHVTFTGRIAFTDVRPLYESSLATILLLPDRYAMAGQMTQRIFEAVLAGCLPLTPAALPFAAEFTPEALHVDDGRQAARARPCRVSESSRIPSRELLVSVPMERIAIVGCGGSGKSHLARVLADRLGITPVHLDVVFYDKD